MLLWVLGCKIVLSNDISFWYMREYVMMDDM